jgi:hypothetical protein
MIRCQRIEYVSCVTHCNLHITTLLSLCLCVYQTGLCAEEIWVLKHRGTEEHRGNDRRCGGRWVTRHGFQSGGTQRSSMLGITERGQSSAGGAFLWISSSQERGRLARLYRAPAPSQQNNRRTVFSTDVVRQMDDGSWCSYWWCGRDARVPGTAGLQSICRFHCLFPKESPPFAQFFVGTASRLPIPCNIIGFLYLRRRKRLC